MTAAHIRGNGNNSQQHGEGTQKWKDGSTYQGQWKDGKIQTRVGSFGDYAVMIDTVPPTIKPEDFQYNLQARKSINFKAADDIGRSGTARGLRYKATIDGKWVLLSYDLKYDRFTHRFDDNLAPGEHTFRLEITDDRDNVAVFEKPFIR